MHEYSIVQALMERVEAEARARQARKVHRLSVRIGELSGVDVGLLRTAFGIFRQRTICEHADLDVQPVVARWQCPSCSGPIPRGEMLRCPNCRAPAELIEGGEIVLDRIEMEVP